MQVRKRDGRIEKWSDGKVSAAIQKAAKDAGEVIEPFEMAIFTSKVGVKCHKEGETISVTVLHTAVEDVLMASKYKNVARKYVEKRSERDRERTKQSKMLKQVVGLIEQTDEEILNQNANKPTRLVATHRDIMAGIVSREFAKQTIPKSVVEAHEKGVIYIHDLDYAISTALHNCGVYDYEGMLRTGFKLGNAKIENPKSLSVACTVLSQIASTISSSSYGGQSVHLLNKLLRPYAMQTWKKIVEDAEDVVFEKRQEWISRKLRKEIYDACQTLIYQINTICGTNGQSAFCTISFCASDDWLESMITEEYLKCHTKGLGAEGITPTFPKVIYFLERGVNLNKTDPHYNEFRLAMQCSVKRMYPDYVMVDNNKKMTGFSNPQTPMG